MFSRFLHETCGRTEGRTRLRLVHLFHIIVVIIIIIIVFSGTTALYMSLGLIAGQVSNLGPPKRSTFSIPWETVSKRLYSAEGNQYLH
jgi:hypothetical protein